MSDEVTKEWRKLHNEELNDLYSSPNIIRVIKTRGMRWWGSLRDRNHLEDPGVCGRIRVRWILRGWMEGMDWIELAQQRDRWWAVVNAVMNLPVP